MPIPPTASKLSRLLARQRETKRPRWRAGGGVARIPAPATGHSSPKMGCETDNPQTRDADLTEPAYRVPPHDAALVLSWIVYRRTVFNPVPVEHKIWRRLQHARRNLGTERASAHTAASQQLDSRSRQHRVLSVVKRIQTTIGFVLPVIATDAGKQIAVRCSGRPPPTRAAQYRLRSQVTSTWDTFSGRRVSSE